MKRKKINKIDLKNIHIDDNFWLKRQNLITDVVIPYQEAILDDKVEGVEKSHAFANFRIAAGLADGEFYGMVFQDSDVAKWLEAAAYSLCIKPDEDLEKRADNIIDIIEKAQQPDGYLNTYFTIKEPEKRWTNLHECHELYCAGHMMEAAAAYYEATGKDKLLRVMERMADHIENRFLAEKREGIPGHQEVEIGLMRMYYVTGENKYLRLAQHFIDERGKNPQFFIEETRKRGWKHEIMDPYNMKYNQSFAPVRNQKTAEGHSVRAVYMYTAMADLAGVTGDEELLKACEAIWENCVNKRMYITGGIGSNAEGEAFTIDYDLPNDSVYAETCASVGLIFWAEKMLGITGDGQYADIMERALYNGALSGMQLDGKRFFYVNPLEVNPGVSGELFGYKHVLPQRPGWYQCACCPPNVARLIASLGTYIWREEKGIIYSDLHIGGTAELENATIRTVSEFPWNGAVSYEIVPKGGKKEFTFALRIPSYAEGYKLSLNGRDITAQYEENKGYCFISREWNVSDKLSFTFDMKIRKVHTNTAVRSNIGCAALQRGPLVYCFEGADNGERLQELHILKKGVLKAEGYQKDLLGGIVPIKAQGSRIYANGELYFEGEFGRKEEMLTAIPYYAWGNRGLNQMRVWIHEDGGIL
jgi:DUF1680 family protein